MPGIAKPYSRKPRSVQRQKFPSRESLFNQYEKYLRHRIGNYFNNPVDQQDALEEVFLKLCRSRTGLDPRKDIRAFIGTIARSVCMDMLRKKLRRREVALSEDVSALFTTDLRRRNPKQTPEKQLLTKEQLERVKTAMKELPKKDQTLLALAQAQWPYNEIADLLGIPVGTVRSRISNARKRLLKILGPDFFEE